MLEGASGCIVVVPHGGDFLQSLCHSRGLIELKSACMLVCVAHSRTLCNIFSHLIPVQTAIFQLIWHLFYPASNYAITKSSIDSVTQLFCINVKLINRDILDIK